MSRQGRLKQLEGGGQQVLFDDTDAQALRCPRTREACPIALRPSPQASISACSRGRPRSAEPRAHPRSPARRPGRSRISSSSSGTSTIRSGAAPSSVFVPTVQVMGRSVVARSRKPHASRAWISGVHESCAMSVSIIVLPTMWTRAASIPSRVMSTASGERIRSSGIDFARRPSTARFSSTARSRTRSRHVPCLRWRAGGGQRPYTGRLGPSAPSSAAATTANESLDQPAVHTRELEVRPDGSTGITDVIQSPGGHEASWTFPLAPRDVVVETGRVLTRFESGAELSSGAGSLPRRAEVPFLSARRLTRSGRGRDRDQAVFPRVVTSSPQAPSIREPACRPP